MSRRAVVRENSLPNNAPIAGEIGAPRPEANCDTRAEYASVRPAAVADRQQRACRGGRYSRPRRARFRIIRRSVAAGTAVNADAAPAAIFHPPAPVATMTLTIDGVRVTPVGELTAAGRTVEEADTAAGD